MIQQNRAYSLGTIEDAEPEYNIMYEAIEQSRPQGTNVTPVGKVPLSLHKLWSFTCVTLTVALLALAIASVLLVFLTVTVAMQNYQQDTEMIAVLQSQLNNSYQAFNSRVNASEQKISTLEQKLVSLNEDFYKKGKSIFFNNIKRDVHT